jgi:ABC-type multidrug transport system fused ATPase/permease subunit
MSPRERARFWILVVITFVLSVIEAGSVISILPFLQLISNPDLVETNRIYAWVYANFGFESTRQFLIAAGIVVFIITVVGLVMKIATIWITTRFALMRSYSFSSRLLASYLHQPYEWFLTRHTARLGTSVLAEVDAVVFGSVLPAVQIIPQVFTISLLIIALCVMEPLIAIGGTLLVGGFYGLVYLSVRKLMSRIGQVQLDANRARFHAVQEAMGGIKELKVIGLEAIYLSRFREAAYRVVRVQAQGQILNVTPRYALEAIAFGGMIILILFLLISRGADIAALVPTLGIIAAAGLRLIPALQLLYSQIGVMRQGAAALESVHHDMTTLGADHAGVRALHESQVLIPLAQRLELRSVVYAYPDAERAALRGLDMTIEANTTIGIVGGTGAGKTTLVDIMLGLLDPQEGEMLVDGTPVTLDIRRAWQKTLGYVPQTIFLSDGSIAENIAFGLPPEKIDRAAIESAARAAALHDFVTTELPRGYDTLVGERGVRLSGGQRQRVGIARALYHNPSTLIFDEATSALDTLTERAVMEAVDALASKKTIVMIAHRLSTVRNCDRIFFLHDGKVAASGRFEELVELDDRFRSMAVGI